MLISFFLKVEVLALDHSSGRAKVLKISCIVRDSRVPEIRKIAQEVPGRNPGDKMVIIRIPDVLFDPGMFIVIFPNFLKLSYFQSTSFRQSGSALAVT